MKRVAAYARVSTDNDEQLSSFDAQMDYYTRHIRSNSAWTFVEVYTDEGMLLNKTHGHEMIASWFVGYLRNGIYMFIVLVLMGSVIPITSADLLLGVGVGLKNTINLKGTLLHSVDGLLQVQFFLLLIIVGILFLGFTIYHLMKKDAHFDKKTGYTRITLFTVVILMSSHEFLDYVW